MSRAIGLALTTFLTTVLVLLLAPSASAWCVYNYTNRTLTIRNGFTPGDFYQEVKPGAENKKCCPADSSGCGKHEIYILAFSFNPDESFLKSLFRGLDCAGTFTRQYYWFVRERRGAGVPDAYVPPHGWVSIEARTKDGVRTPYGIMKENEKKVVWEGFARITCGSIM